MVVVIVMTADGDDDETGKGTYGEFVNDGWLTFDARSYQTRGTSC